MLDKRNSISDQLKLAEIPDTVWLTDAFFFLSMIPESINSPQSHSVNTIILAYNVNFQTDII